MLRNFQCAGWKKCVWPKKIPYIFKEYKIRVIIFIIYFQISSIYTICPNSTAIKFTWIEYTNVIKMFLTVLFWKLFIFNLWQNKRQRKVDNEIFNLLVHCPNAHMDRVEPVKNQLPELNQALPGGWKLCKPSSVVSHISSKLSRKWKIRTGIRCSKIGNSILLTVLHDHFSHDIPDIYLHRL